MKKCFNFTLKSKQEKHKHSILLVKIQNVFKKDKKNERF